MKTNPNKPKRDKIRFKLWSKVETVALGLTLGIAVVAVAILLSYVIIHG